MPFDDITQQALPSQEVTRLHVFRHGQVQTGGQRLAYGHSDVLLSPAGERQHAAIVEYARRHLSDVDGVVCSDLKRCMHLAQALGEALGLPVRAFTALREQHMGNWESQPWSELTAADEARVQAYWDDYVQTRPPGGESFDDVVKRVAGWWQEEADALRDGNWIVITHIGVIRALGCSMLGVPIDQALRLAPARGSYTRLLLSDTGGVTECLGVPIGSENPLASRDLSRPPRLALAGSAGTGKTTLGQRLAQDFNVPFLEEGMRARLEAGLDLHTLDIEQLVELVESLWQEQRTNEAEAISTHGGFVSDRSSVDFAAFWLHYGFAHDRDRAAAFIRDTISHAEAYDGIIVLPWNALPLVADGYRSTNPWIQKRYQALLEGLLHRDVSSSCTHLLPTDCLSIEDRMRWVRAAIGRPA